MQNSISYFFFLDLGEKCDPDMFFFMLYIQRHSIFQHLHNIGLAEQARFWPFYAIFIHSTVARWGIKKID